MATFGLVKETDRLFGLTLDMNVDAFHHVLSDASLGTVIDFGGTRIGVAGDPLGIMEGGTMVHKLGDAGGTHGVVTNI